MRSITEPAVQDEPSFIEAARRAQIIECAIDAIADVGFARATLTEIARRAKVTKGVILYYFDGKDDLIRKVVESIYIVGSEYMVPLLEQQPTVRDTLRTYIESNIAYMGEKRTYMVAMVEIFSGFRDRDGVSKLDASGVDLAKEHLAEMLRSGQVSGEFRDFDPDAMAFAIRAAIDMVPPALTYQPDIDIRRLSEQLTETFDIATRKQNRPGRKKVSS